ncbi:hypothetical protein Goklo_008470 [Gossypium klotzschianum]|uniref:1-phosphatidylinositol-4-phosphate 5-kinase n=1 Tax=Gossypium klotzschianum TaxID=34286 RepID=A0A7J8V082_9ROSI|nr:hypothetical protein [Gossypium klotzschianum]
MAFSDKELMTTDYMIQCSRHHCNNLPPGIVTGFEWKDYCPKSFRLIQELENIDNDDYMMVVCSDETIKQVTSTVRPGNMFLFSNDSRFAIKTLRKSELKEFLVSIIPMQVLLEMLPSYYSHIKRFRSTILNKLYGAHVVKPAGGTKVYFVVVANIFKSDLLMHRCYDLKGSLQGRKVEKMRYREKTLHKESDLDFLFYLEPLARQRILKKVAIMPSKNPCYSWHVFAHGDQNHRKKLNSDVTFEICIAELDRHLARKFYKKAWDCKIGDLAGKEMTVLTGIDDINPRAFICDFILTVVRGGERKTEEERRWKK